MDSRAFYFISLIVVAWLMVPPAQGAEFAGKPYLFASIGDTDAEFRPNVSDQIDGGDNAFELGVGFAFNSYFTVEASYQDFGDPDGFPGCPPDFFCITVFAPEPVSINGWSAALRGSVPVSETLSVFGRLGFLAWDASARTPSLNESGTDLLYGAGISADYSETWGLQLSYERVDLGIETLKLGVRLRF